MVEDEEEDRHDEYREEGTAYNRSYEDRLGHSLIDYDSGFHRTRCKTDLVTGLVLKCVIGDVCCRSKRGPKDVYGDGWVRPSFHKAGAHGTSRVKAD